MTNSLPNQVIAPEVMQHFISQLQNNPEGITPLHLLQNSMNLLMQAERQLHLKQNPHDKGNGYFSRELGTPMGTLELAVPRDRDGDFRPAILPDPYQRDYADRKHLLESLIINGYSPNQIQSTLNALHLHYNPEEIENLRDHYAQIFHQWQQRELPHDVIGLFIDAYHADALIDQKVRKVVIYVVIGIDFTGYKSLYGLYLFAGSESKGFWLQTLNQLISRGIKAPLFILSDDFSGLKEAIATLFPQALHQLCFIHMQRNLHKNLAKEDAKNFNQTLETLKILPNADQAQDAFHALCQQYQPKYPAYMQLLSSKSTHYFAFMHLCPEVRKYFYTTNIVESFNSILEKNRIRMGGFFQSEPALKVNVFFIMKKLTAGKWRKGVPHLISNLYSIRQLFAIRYERLPNEVKMSFDSK